MEAELKDRLGLLVLQSRIDNLKKYLANTNDKDHQTIQLLYSDIIDYEINVPEDLRDLYLKIKAECERLAFQFCITLNL